MPATGVLVAVAVRVGVATATVVLVAVGVRVVVGALVAVLLGVGVRVAVAAPVGVLVAFGVRVAVGTTGVNVGVLVVLVGALTASNGLVAVQSRGESVKPSQCAGMKSSSSSRTR